MSWAFKEKSQIIIIVCILPMGGTGYTFWSLKILCLKSPGVENTQGI